MIYSYENINDFQPFDLSSLCKETPKSSCCNDATDRTIMFVLKNKELDQQKREN